MLWFSLNGCCGHMRTCQQHHQLSHLIFHLFRFSSLSSGDRSPIPFTPSTNYQLTCLCRNGSMQFSVGFMISQSDEKKSKTPRQTNHHHRRRSSMCLAFELNDFKSFWFWSKRIDILQSRINHYYSYAKEKAAKK